MSSRIVSVWPCNHGDVEVEPVAVPLGLACAECGSYPEHFVPKTEYDRAVEAREKANAVSVRVEAENRRLREALHTICGLTHQDIDEEPFWRLVSRIHHVARAAVGSPVKETS